MSKTLPRTITPAELVKGQHISVRHNYDQKHSTIYEGLVARFGEETVILEGEEHERWAVPQPKVDVTLTLLTDPESVYEVGQLAEITFNSRTDTEFALKSATPIRAWWDGYSWRLIGTNKPRVDYVVAPDDILTVEPLRIAGPQDIIIPVKDGMVTLGGKTRSIHEVVGDLDGGLGGELYEEMSKLFCPVNTFGSLGECCLIHNVHAKNCKCHRSGWHDG